MTFTRTPTRRPPPTEVPTGITCRAGNPRCYPTETPRYSPTLCQFRNAHDPILPPIICPTDVPTNTPIPIGTAVPSNTHTPAMTFTPTSTPQAVVRYYHDSLFPPDDDVEGCPSGEAGRLECSEQVLDAFYTTFQTTYGRAPVFGELIATLYMQELGLVIGTDPSKQAMGNNFVNSCGSGCNRTGLIAWLSSKQGWYIHGRSGGADVTQLLDAVNDADALSISQAIVGAGMNWPGACTTNVDIPCDWGNWALGDQNYDRVRAATVPTVRCVIVQFWFDPDDNNQPNRPPDTWGDYVFAIVTYT